MCRIAAYLGPPVPLASVVYDAPHGLERQAYAPREMLKGHVNVDGTGLAWWPPDEVDRAPVRYVTDRPPWADPNLPSLAARLNASLVMAAVRSASPGVSFGPGHVAPFVIDGIAGVHNGWLGKFREGVGRALAARLPDDLYAAAEVANDSLLVVLTVVSHVRSGLDLPGALGAALRDVLEVCGGAGAEATLNVVVADGRRIVASRVARGTEGNNPLYALQGGSRWPGATLLASEPLDDDPEWSPLADDHLIDVAADGLVVTALELPK